MRIVCCLVSLFVTFASQVMAQKNSEGANKNTPYSVTLRGQIKGIELRDVTASGVTIVVKLKLEARNDGAKPVIFLEDDSPQITGATLTKSPSDPFTKALVANHWGPSVDTSAKWSNLRRSLDKASPPRDMVRVLAPNETWWLEKEVYISVPTEAGNHSYFPKRASFETIQEYSAVWLHVNCQVWPLNVEPSSNDRSKLKFGRALQRRWKDVGLLWLDSIYSEPIMLDLKTATYKTKTP